MRGGTGFGERGIDGHSRSYIQKWGIQVVDRPLLFWDLENLKGEPCIGKITLWKYSW